MVQVFKELSNCSFNLLSDRQYVVQAVKILETVGSIKSSSTILELLRALQALIWERKVPFCILHIRAHTGLPVL